MICRQCGAEVPEGQPICPYCGTKMMRHLSDNDIEKLTNMPSIPEEISGAHFAAPPTNDPVHPDDAGVTAYDVEQGSAHEVLDVVEIDVHEQAYDITPGVEPAEKIPTVEDMPQVVAEQPASPEVNQEAQEPTSTVIYGSENTLAESQPSVTAPIEASPERRRLERMVRRAKRRSLVQAARRGIEQQDHPHIHVHDNNQSLSAFRLSAPEEHRDWLRRNRLIAGIVSCACVILLGIAIAFGTWQAELWGGHTIDDVRGMTSTDATARLVADGFQVVLAEEPSENSVGFVVAMSPEPGVRADKGTTVTIYVGVNPDNASANTTEGSEG